MKKILFYSLIIILPLGLRAADVYIPLEPLPCIAGSTSNCGTGASGGGINIEDYIGYMFKFAIAISAFLAVVMIVWGGFEIMLSEAVQGKMDGKEKVYNAITGLLMVLSSYLILYTIDPRLVQINVKLPDIKIGKGLELGTLEEISASSTSNLSKRLNNLNTLDSKKIAEIDKTVLSKQDALREIQDQIENATYLNLTPDEVESLYVDAQILKDEIKAEKTKRVVTVTKSDATSQYGKLVELLSNPVKNTSEITGDIRLEDIYDENVANLKQAMDGNFERAIKLAEKTGDVEALKEIRGQQKFFYDQLELDMAAQKTISYHDQAALEKNIAYLEKNSQLSVEQLSDIGIDKAVYDQIQEDRINRLSVPLHNIKVGDAELKLSKVGDSWDKLNEAQLLQLKIDKAIYDEVLAK
ncbi:MAG: pilin, partial [Bacteroidota bacterium]